MDETLDKPTTTRRSRMPAAAKAVDPSRQVPHLLPGSARMMEEVCNRIYVDAPPGLDPEDLNGSEAYALLAGVRQLVQKFSDIRVGFDNCVVDVIVVDVGPGFVTGRVVQVIALPKHIEHQGPRIPDGFEVRPALPSERPQVGWLAVRLSDGIVLSAGHILETREDATRFLLDHASVTKR